MDAPARPAPSRRHDLELVFVTDPVESLNPCHDTSVALIEAAQARGHRVLATTMAGLGIRDGQTTAVCAQLKVVPATLRDGRWHASPDWYRAVSAGAARPGRCGRGVRTHRPAG